ncbi:MAG: hypothetical protein SGI94_19050 [Saprospiraceae bacterium]|nr:hypothetical protein [Saprospiraceae bacterium]
MVAYQNIYESLAEFIASMDPEKVLAFHAPADIQTHVEILRDKKKSAGLSEQEQDELEHYFILEHIVRLAKSRARLHLYRA